MKLFPQRLIVFVSLLLLMVGLGSTNLKSEEDNLIIWNESYRLKWSDFKAAPDNNTNMKALTYSSVKVHSHSSSGGELVVEISCFFDRNQSWTKDTINVQLLKHEQLHFDITELYTRMMRQKMTLIKEKDPQKKMDAVSKIFQSVMKDCSEEQDKYDNETNHGIIKEKQEEWIGAVKKRLAQYAAYKSK